MWLMSVLIGDCGCTLSQHTHAHSPGTSLFWPQYALVLGECRSVLLGSAFHPPPGQGSDPSLLHGTPAPSHVARQSELRTQASAVKELSVSCVHREQERVLPSWKLYLQVGAVIPGSE